MTFSLMFQAKSTYSHQGVATDVIENLKIEDVEKLADDLQKIVDKLKDIKHNYIDHSKEEFKKKSQNALEFLKKMPQKCIPKKAEQVQQISMSGMSSFLSCQGFTDALNTAKELLSEAEYIGFAIAMSLSDVADEINNCTKKGPFLAVYCLADLMKTSIPQHIQGIIDVVSAFTQIATSELQLIVADIISCFTQASKLTDDKMALLLEEVRLCANSGHS